MITVPKIRPAARILLVDEYDRTFLFKSLDPANPTTEFWCPVGGGIESGESPEDAARREVFEETGLSDFELGPLVWKREHIVSFNGSLIHTKEHWFLARVKHFIFSDSGFTEMEKNSILEHKWWAQSELENTKEALTPRRLAALMPALLRGEFPDPPMSIGA